MPGSTSSVVGTDAHESAQQIWISGKHVEEVGYDKIALKQAQLHHLSVVILDQASISTKAEADGESSTDCGRVLPNLVELDIGRNLFESIDQVAALCDQFATLKTLTLDGNRVDVTSGRRIALEGIQTLSLNSMLLLPDELLSVLEHFPNAQSLSLTGNQLSTPLIAPYNLSLSLTSLNLEDNGFTSLQHVLPLVANCSSLQTLGLKYNSITETATAGAGATLAHGLRLSDACVRLDLTGNDIHSWASVDSLLALASGLKHLQISKNPIYAESTGPSGRALAEADISLLIIARLPRLRSLNYSDVADKDRLNGEKLYLSFIAEELATVPTEEADRIIAKHPRYSELCEEYGEPVIQRQTDTDIDPNSLAARLIECTFLFPPSLSIREDEIQSPLRIELPKSLSIYSLLGLIGKRLNILPSSFRLIWETGERGPAGSATDKMQTVQEVQEWDSEDEDDDGQPEAWVERTVELMPGTRPLGTIIEKREATISIVLKNASE